MIYLSPTEPQYALCAIKATARRFSVELSPFQKSLRCEATGAGMSIEVHVAIEDRGAAIATGDDMKKVSTMRGQTLTSAVLIMCLLVSSCTSLKGGADF